MRTVELYRHLFDRHILPSLADPTLVALTPSKVRGWCAALVQAHPATAAKSYRLLANVVPERFRIVVLLAECCQLLRVRIGCMHWATSPPIPSMQMRAPATQTRTWWAAAWPPTVGPCRATSWLLW